MNGPMPLGAMLGGDQGTPTPTPVQPQNPTRPSNSVGGAWSNWMSKPENRAAMIQAGVQLMQPIAPGQSIGGHFGQAIGSGAAAMGRNVEGRQKAQMAERGMAVEEANARTRARSAENEAQGLSAYQRHRAFMEFAKREAAAMAEQAFTAGTGDPMATADTYLSQIMSDPELRAELEAKFEATESYTTGSTLGEATQPGTQGAKIKEGGRAMGKDGKVYVMRGGQMVLETE